MKKIFFKFNQVTLILVITLITTFFFISSNILLTKLLEQPLNIPDDIIQISILALLFIPLISFYFVRFVFKINMLEKEIKTLETHDELTGLLNRHAFYHACEGIHEYSLRNKKTYSLVAVKLGDFDKIRQFHGYEASDKVLATFGRIAKKLTRKSDIIGRTGERTFAFLLPDTNKKQAEEFAIRLRDKTTKLEVIVNHQHIKYTISIGITDNVDKTDLNVEGILNHATKLLNF